MSTCAAPGCLGEVRGERDGKPYCFNCLDFIGAQVASLRDPQPGEFIGVNLGGKPVTPENIDAALIAKGIRPSGRYLGDLGRDDKSGYRLAVRPIAMVEHQVLDLLHRCGGQTMALVLQHGSRAGVPEQETSHAVLRLVVKGKVDYDLPLGILTRAVPKLGFWRRLMNRVRGGVHPALVAIGCFIGTAGGCALWIYSRSLSV